MKIWIIAAGLLLIITTLPGVCASPDFAWRTDCAQLTTAGEKWQSAALVSPTKSSEHAQPQPFNTVYLRQVLSKNNFSDSAYPLLNDAMRRQRLLDESKKLYLQALKQCKPDNSDRLTTGFNEAYLELKYYVSLATSLARAGIAHKMADNQSSGYCFQAMEAAIDVLAAAQKVETDSKRLESLEKLRAKLFAVWEKAQRTRDLSLIRDFDLLRAFDESVSLNTKQAGTQ